MLLKKKGYPEDSELVLCTVKSVHPNSVFVVLDEYGKAGLVHISEVSPGRIRNIRDFVVEGKKIVCLVLKIDEEKGHIDLSLRRVNERQKREKIDSIKQEQKAEKMLEYVAKNELKVQPEKLYEAVSPIIFKRYDSLYSCFLDIALGNADLVKMGVDKKTAEPLTKLVKDRITPPEVSLEVEMDIETHAPDGIDQIKDALVKADSLDMVSITYEGGGKYKMQIKAPEYKAAEKLLDKCIEDITSAIEKIGKVEIKRKK